jgi:hypothetical protein
MKSENVIQKRAWKTPRIESLDTKETRAGAGHTNEFVTSNQFCYHTVYSKYVTNSRCLDGGGAS